MSVIMYAVKKTLNIVPMIKDMPVGTYAYTLPWAMSVDADENVFIRGDYPAHEESRGTACLSIKRTEEGIQVETWTADGQEFYKGHTIPAAWYPLPVTLV